MPRSSMANPRNHSRWKRRYWRFLRTRRALADRISYEELFWSQTFIPEEELRRLVRDWKGWVFW